VPYGADGIAIDFEQLPSSQKANMVTFLRDLKAQLHAQVPQGDVWVATPAVDWSGAWDYDQIMDGIDGMFVMAYDYHYRGSGQAGPVAPLTSGSIWGTYNITWTIADYKAYGMPRAYRKVTLGFPYYGYDWPTTSTAIPASTTGQGSAVLYDTAVPEAQQYGRGWDPNAQNPYYMYGGPRQVWYDDEESLGLKYDAVVSERMGGTGMWALGYDGTRPELWDKLREKLVRTSLAGLAVGIDPGHGGSDGGSVGPTGLREKDVTLDVALQLAAMLQAAGATVVLTRSADVDVTVAERVTTLNQAQVDRAISIHLGDAANPAVNESVAHVYGNATVGSLSDSRSEAWAERTVGRTASYAAIGKGASNVGVPGVDAFDDARVRDTEMSSILVHPSHITNPQEEARLSDPAYRCGLAHALYQGLADSFGIMTGPAGCAGARVVALAGPGAGPSNPPRIRAFELPSGATPVLDIAAYGATGYGAKAAGGDVDGDGAGEILTGPGPGAVYGPQVRAFDGTGSPLSGVNFFAYGTLRYGVNVGAGDVEHASRDAIVTAPGPGAVFGPHVRGFRRTGTAVAPLPGLSFYAYATLRYGARASAGDLDGGGRHELATAPGPGSMFGPQIRGFAYTGAVAAMAKVNFWAFPQSGNGAKVDVAPSDGDAFEEILAGRGEGPSHAADVTAWNYDGAAISPMPGISFTPLPTLRGANVAGADVDVDGTDELLASGGPDPAAPTRLVGFAIDGGSPVPVSGLDFAAFPGMAYGAEVGGARLGP
jgi:N-acetylmuramoyl-L-alanine amidase